MPHAQDLQPNRRLAAGDTDQYEQLGAEPLNLPQPVADALAMDA
jgi:hypothetical protein